MGQHAEVVMQCRNAHACGSGQIVHAHRLRVIIPDPGDRPRRAEDGRYGIADGIQAIKVLREHAAELGVSPDRIVFMGFSAGGSIAEFASVNPDVNARPNYAAPIYGAPFPDLPPIPKGVPPFFMEMAQDDNLAGPQIVAIYEALEAAGYKPEFHIYEHGGHGWSMRRQGTTSDHWLEEFYWWLEAQGLTKPRK